MERVSPNSLTNQEEAGVAETAIATERKNKHQTAQQQQQQQQKPRSFPGRHVDGT